MPAPVPSARPPPRARSQAPPSRPAPGYPKKVRARKPVATIDPEALVEFTRRRASLHQEFEVLNERDAPANLPHADVVQVLQLEAQGSLPCRRPRRRRPPARRPSGLLRRRTAGRRRRGRLREGACAAPPLGVEAAGCVEDQPARRGLSAMTRASWLSRARDERTTEENKGRHAIEQGCASIIGSAAWRTQVRFYDSVTNGRGGSSSSRPSTLISTQPGTSTRGGCATPSERSKNRRWHTPRRTLRRPRHGTAVSVARNPRARKRRKWLTSSSIGARGSTTTQATSCRFSNSLNRASTSSIANTPTRAESSHDEQVDWHTPRRIARSGRHGSGAIGRGRVCRPRSARRRRRRGSCAGRASFACLLPLNERRIDRSMRAMRWRLAAPLLQPGESGRQRMPASRSLAIDERESSDASLHEFKRLRLVYTLFCLPGWLVTSVLVR